MAAKSIPIRNTSSSIISLPDFKTVEGKEVCLGIAADDALVNARFRSTCEVSSATFESMRKHPAVLGMFEDGILRAGEIRMV